MELMQIIIAIAQLAFILSSMIGVGLGLRVSETIEPLEAMAETPAESITLITLIQRTCSNVH
jgi:hypothetical protein